MCLECKGRSTFCRRGALRAVTLTCGTLLSLATPPAARAQADCADVPAAAATDLRGFRALFRQAGVAFAARLANDSTPAAALAITNQNATAVAVDFGTFLEVGGDSGPAEVSAGRRCVRLAPGQVVVLPAEAPGGAGEAVRAVRVRNLNIAGLQTAPGADQGEPEQGVVPPADGPAEAAIAAPPAEQFRCASGTDAAARGACTAAYLAASARAAVLADAFAGISRACLLEYAALQERAADLLRRGDPLGEQFRLAVPACYSREDARWDFAMLHRFCPDAVWTPQDGGTASCQLPLGDRAADAEEGPVAGSQRTGALAPSAPGAASRRGLAELRRPSPTATSDLQLVLRMAFGTVLVLAGLALLVPLLQALALLLVVAPVALLRRAFGPPAPGR